MLDKKDRKPVGNRQRYFDLNEAEIEQLQKDACADDDDSSECLDRVDVGFDEDESVGHLAEEIVHSGEDIDLPTEDGDVEIVEDDCLSPNDGAQC